MSWNKAAMQWANYRTPKPRVMHAPVGEKCLANTGLERCDRWVGTSIVFAPGEVSCCSVCGYHVCHCAPKPSNAELCAAANARMHAERQRVRAAVDSWDWENMRPVAK